MAIHMGVNPDALREPAFSEVELIRLETDVDGGDDPDDPCRCGCTGIHDHVVHSGKNPMRARTIIGLSRATIRFNSVHG